MIKEELADHIGEAIEELAGPDDYRLDFDPVRAREPMSPSIREMGMGGLTVYLDSGAIVKRCVQESGSGFILELHRKAYSVEAKLFLSLWNIGEVLGALDRARRIGRMDQDGYDESRRNLLLETKRLVKLNLMEIVPLKSRVLHNSWKILEKHYSYEADALQIASAKHANADQFLTGDRRLHEVASEEGLGSLCLESL